MTRKDLDIVLRALTPVVREMAHRIAAKERGLDGKDGARGAEGPEGRAGRDGLPGQPGRDGLSGEKGLDGEVGAPGTHGRDGTLEQLKAMYDGERTLTFCFKNGDPIEGGVITLPIVIDRGVYKAETSYVKGDGVTFGGAFFIAQCDTSAKPAASDDWRLAVQRGRDGKQGPEGKKGLDGKDGRPQMASDGTRW